MGVPRILIWAPCHQPKIHILSPITESVRISYFMRCNFQTSISLLFYKKMTYFIVVDIIVNEIQSFVECFFWTESFTSRLHSVPIRKRFHATTSLLYYGGCSDVYGRVIFQFLLGQNKVMLISNFFLESLQSFKFFEDFYSRQKLTH